MFSLFKKGATMPAFVDGLVGPLPSQERIDKKLQQIVYLVTFSLSNFSLQKDTTSPAFVDGPVRPFPFSIKKQLKKLQFVHFFLKKVPRCRHLWMD